MLQKIPDDYKSKVAALEKSHKKATSAKNEELAKVRAELKTKAQAMSEKEAALRDLSLQHSLLIRTLYGVMSSLTVEESTLRRSLAPAEDEIDEEKAL